MDQLYREIQEQPDVFGRIRDQYINEDFFRYWNKEVFGKIILTGMGSSLFAAYPCYLRLLERGFPVNWIDASELLHYGLDGLREDDTLLFFSQSGESYELLKIVESLPKKRPRLIGVTAHPNSALGGSCDEIIDIMSGPERAITSTKTHSSMVAVANLWAMALVGEKQRFLDSALAFDLLVQEADRVIQSAPEWARRTLRNLEFTRGTQTKAIIARGPALSSAWHGCLCFYECAKEPFMSFTGGQFRHGPLELAFKPMLAIVLALPGKTNGIMCALASELLEKKCGVLLIGQCDTKAGLAHEVLSLRFPDEYFGPLLSIIPLELLSYYLAEEKGIEPGTAYLISKTTSRE
ncbi:MAG TPA: SIS domain-containing protein [Atribacteraceae bacterium]|nr:SIS domain-containing protein [Atribacteraceae bacterium]